MNNNEINLERLTDNIWHIHAVYQRLVRENKIYPSTADGCESLRNFELEAITKMAIEFDKNWGNMETNFIPMLIKILTKMPSKFLQKKD